ncbi:MAG: serine/threonine-protein phosphatase, partial [Leptonema sp. (in: Bacteria)]|nr:serine/threonine-protein phosphatase [Leptonema sp. (in: bacteria)]
NSEEVGAFIADVTGHGTPAALFASLVRYTFQTYKPYIADPSGLCEGMNRSIYGRTGTYFLTAGYLFVSTRLRVARYASCGHPPLIYQRYDGTVQPIKGRGRAMAVVESNRPETIEIKINSGDRLFLYTDGLEEVIEKIKHTSVADWLSRFRLEPLQAIQDDIRSLIHANRNSKNSIDDDITWILIEIE